VINSLKCSAADWKIQFSVWKFSSSESDEKREIAVFQKLRSVTPESEVEILNDTKAKRHCSWYKVRRPDFALFEFRTAISTGEATGEATG
jgi:hypothetical protein